MGLSCKYHVHHVLLFPQKLPKVNRSLAEKLIDEKKDARKEAVKVRRYQFVFLCFDKEID